MNKQKLLMLLALLGVIVTFSSTVLAIAVDVPNGDFETLYKPGTAIIGIVQAGGWSFGVGPDCPIENGTYEFADTTTGDNADIAGWVGYDTATYLANPGSYDRPNKNPDHLTPGDLQGSVSAQGVYAGAMCYLSNGGGWGNPIGGLITSAASLGNVSDMTYTLSMMATIPGAEPIVLDLLADGVALTATASSVTPDGNWNLHSKTYDAASLAGVLGQELTIVIGVGRDATGTQTKFDDVTLEVDINIYPADDPEGLDPLLLNTPLTLSWGNWAPSDPDVDDSVYVDVWFGTEPNEANTAYDMTKIVVAAADVDFVTVDASAEGIYYWKVNTNIGEPNIVEGELWSFTVLDDPAPTVVIDDPNQMTWSGEGVPLVADIKNLGASATIIEWVADPADDVEILDGDTATPTVTITKAPSYTAKIPSAGFEDPVVADGTYDGSTPTGWTIINGGIADAAPGAMIDIVDEGEQCAWANPDGSLSTVLSETVQAGATYTLSVGIGHGQWSNGVKYLVQLIAVDGENEVVLAEDDNSLTIAAQTWETSVVLYTNDPVADANKLDLPLMVKLVNPADSPGGADVEFDNVVLTSDTLFPVATGVETVTMTVLVSDGGNPIPVEASVEIDVYDDACHMARAAFGKDDPNDLDKDCDIDIDDLAVIAATWLNDTSIDTPAASPDQTDSPLVINGDFAMWQPGTNYTVQATFVGNTYVSDGFGDNATLNGSDNTVLYGDGTTGSTVDITGWITPADGGAGLTANTQFWSTGYDNEDGTSCLNAFGAWSGQNGNLAKSDAPIDLPVRGTGGVYTLSAMVNGGAGAKTFDLLVDGVKVDPDTSVDPADDGWQEISRTYSSIPAGDARILVGIARPFDPGTEEAPGVDRLTGARLRYDNMSLDVVVDANLPSVDTGENMITWTDEAVELSSTVTAGLISIVEGSLSYLWTAYPEDGVVFDSNSIENPTVTITKSAGDMASVRLTLSVTIDGVASVVSDSIIIDVYDNACLAGLASDPELDYDLGDINVDCTTNLEDFAMLATSWLDDYSSTGPLDRPEEE